MTILIEGQLEIDQERGVIYFHSNKTGHTPLRICSLPKPIPDPSEFAITLDITHMHSCSWRGKTLMKLIGTKFINDDIYKG